MIKSAATAELQILESDRLILRQFCLEDATHIFEIRSNASVMKFMDSNHHASINDSENFVKRNLENQKEGSGYFWALVDKESGEFIGDFSVWAIDKVNHRGQIGYSLKQQYWKKGYMTEAMKVILKFGFTELNLHSFEANINPLNEGSRKCLEKMGFKKEAYFRENYFYNGKYLDSEIYCLLEEDLS